MCNLNRRVLVWPDVFEQKYPTHLRISGKCVCFGADKYNLHFHHLVGLFVFLLFENRKMNSIKKQIPIIFK